MAKPIIVRLGGADSVFQHARVDRAMLYGKRLRVPLDPDGQPCTRASLTTEGDLLLRAGMTNQGYFNAEGHQVPTSELVGLDDDDQELPRTPGTLGEPQELTPADPRELLEMRVRTVYALEAEHLDSELARGLEAGDLFRFRFSYRADWRSEEAFLVQNDHGVFALIGATAAPVWSELAQTSSPQLEDDDEDDELDFEMF